MLRDESGMESGGYPMSHSNKVDIDKIAIESSFSYDKFSYHSNKKKHSSITLKFSQKENELFENALDRLHDEFTALGWEKDVVEQFMNDIRNSPLANGDVVSLQNIIIERTVYATTYTEKKINYKVQDENQVQSSVEQTKSIGTHVEFNLTVDINNIFNNGDYPIKNDHPKVSFGNYDRKGNRALDVISTERVDFYLDKANEVRTDNQNSIVFNLAANAIEAGEHDLLEAQSAANEYGWWSSASTYGARANQTTDGLLSFGLSKVPAAVASKANAVVLIADIVWSEVTAYKMDKYAQLAFSKYESAYAKSESARNFIINKMQKFSGSLIVK